MPETHLSIPLREPLPRDAGRPHLIAGRFDVKLLDAIAGTIATTAELGLSELIFVEGTRPRRWSDIVLHDAAIEPVPSEPGRLDAPCGNFDLRQPSKYFAPMGCHVGSRLLSSGIPLGRDEKDVAVCERRPPATRIQQIAWVRSMSWLFACARQSDLTAPNPARSSFREQSFFGNGEQTVRPLIKWIAVIFLGGVLALAGAHAAPASSKTATSVPTAAFEVDDNVLKIEPGKPSGKAAFLLTLKGEGAKQACSLALTPVPIPNPPHVEITFTTEAQSVKDTSQSWFVTAHVKEMPIAAVPLTRRLIATCGPHSDVVRYTLDNSLVEQFAWKFAPFLAERRWDGVEPLALDVFVGPLPATEVQLMPPQLSESDGFRILSSRFKLCTNASGDCDGLPLNLKAKQRQALWVRPDPTTPPSPGVYKGNIVIVAAEKPDGETFATTLHVSSDESRIWGSVFILLGIILSFMLTQVLRGWSDRNAMMQPAALLVSQLELLVLKRDRLNVRLPEIDIACNRITNELAKPNLAKFLPRYFAVYQPPAGIPVAGETYQQLLTRLAGELGSLSIIVERGVAVLLAEVSLAQPDAEREIVGEAISDLDRLTAGDIAKPDIIAGAVRDRVARMHVDIAKARQVAGLESDTTTTTVDVGYTSKHLAFQTFAINLSGWLIFALLSWAAGTYLLVARDNDFGQLQDLLLCLLWGLGLPSAGQGLSSLTSAGIGQSLGLTVTRA